MFARKPAIPDHAPRILVCRLSHIGDCVLTLPMVQELRRGLPEAHIVWAMERPASELLQGHPAVDRIQVVPRRWMRSLQTIVATRRELRAGRFDIAIDSQSLLKSAVVARLSGARLRFGFRGRHGRERTTWINNVLVEPRCSHLVERSLELIRPLVPDAAFRGFELPLPAQAKHFVSDWLARAGIGGPFAVLNPGAGWRSKQWGADRYARLAVALEKEAGVPSIITWAGDVEQALAQATVTGARQAARLAPRTSLTELAALCRKAAVFVGGDTGPLHIAAAAGTRCVGLHGTTRAEDSRAYGPGHFALQSRYDAGSCRYRRNAGNEAVREISVEAVRDACLTAIANPVPISHPADEAA